MIFLCLPFFLHQFHSIYFPPTHSLLVSLFLIIFVSLLVLLYHFMYSLFQKYRTLKFCSTLTPAHLRSSLNITSLFITNTDIHGYKSKTIFGLVSTEKQHKCILFYIWVSVHHKSIIYNKLTRCNSGSIVFINNYKYALHVSDALCVHHQKHYKL